MVLKPEGQARFRVAVLGRKRLPETAKHERIWGFIDRVTNRGSVIDDEFQKHRYSTKTRGERTLPPARSAGEGVYALVQRRRNLHLTYELKLPRRPAPYRKSSISSGRPHTSFQSRTRRRHRQRAPAFQNGKRHVIRLSRSFAAGGLRPKARIFSTMRAPNSSSSVHARIPSKPMTSISRRSMRRRATRISSVSSRCPSASTRSNR